MERQKNLKKIIGVKNSKKKLKKRKNLKIEIKKIDKKLGQDKRLEKFIIKN